MPDPQVANRAVDQVLIKAASYIKKFPVGAGSSIFNPDPMGGIINDFNRRAQLYPAPGESFNQWVDRVDREMPGFSVMMGVDNAPHGAWKGDQAGMQRSMVYDALNDKNHPLAGGGFSPEELGQLRSQSGFADPNKIGGTEQAPGAPTGPSGPDVLRAFAMHLMDPKSMDINDPYVKQLVATAGGAAQDDARMRGLNGGYAVSNTERAVTGALTAAQQQRQQLGVQALGAAEGIDLQQAQLAQQAYNQQWQAQMAQLQQGYNQRVGAGQGIGGIIGGVGGAIVGGYIGGPAGAQAGMSAGSAAGAGIGGMAAGGGGSPYLPYQPPAYGSSRRGGY